MSVSQGKNEKISWQTNVVHASVKACPPNRTNCKYEGRSEIWDKAKWCNLPYLRSFNLELLWPQTIICSNNSNFAVAEWILKEKNNELTLERYRVPVFCHFEVLSQCNQEKNCICIKTNAFNVLISIWKLRFISCHRIQMVHRSSHRSEIFSHTGRPLSVVPENVLGKC